MKKGPTGILIVQPNGGEAMSHKQLLTEFASGLVAALLAGIVLTPGQGELRDEGAGGPPDGRVWGWRPSSRPTGTGLAFPTTM